MEQQRIQQDQQKEEQKEDSASDHEEDLECPLENIRDDPNNMTFSEAKQPVYKDLNEFQQIQLDKH
jgi:hypothetical protein